MRMTAATRRQSPRPQAADILETTSTRPFLADLFLILRRISNAEGGCLEPGWKVQLEAPLRCTPRCLNSLSLRSLSSPCITARAQMYPQHLFVRQKQKHFSGMIGSSNGTMALRANRSGGSSLWCLFLWQQQWGRTSVMTSSGPACGRRHRNLPQGACQQPRPRTQCAQTI